MKNSAILLLAISFVFLASCSNQKSETANEEHPTSQTASESIPGNYGADVDADNIVSPAEMVSVVNKEGNFEGKINGEIKEVCTKKGCWLTMDLPNGESMRVTFKDYEFFVPTNSQGYSVILDGVALMTETDVETLQHYAEDQGKSKEEIAAITEPKREITFEAVGVIIQEKS